MKMKTLLIACALASLAAPLRAELAPGQPAPDFTLQDQTGRTRKLSDAKGKYVVLEWYNGGCPFVRRQYDDKNMPALQKKYAKEGVTWFTVASSAPGRQGTLTTKTAAKAWKKEGMSSALLIDPNSEVARLYGAKTTPHMFVIDPKGNLIYMGAIDDKPSTDKSDDPKNAHNYVAAALDAAMSGKPVETPVTQSYGCSVKY
ncbi:MAG TPA: thioredoxin family protein [Elusimicrobiota bacterium]|nr:thioredoxin family protein [Elusimicrobiota bacterium]